MVTSTLTGILHMPSYIDTSDCGVRDCEEYKTVVLHCRSEVGNKIEKNLKRVENSQSTFVSLFLYR